jgi:hypothetical protein
MACYPALGRNPVDLPERTVANAREGGLKALLGLGLVLVAVWLALRIVGPFSNLIGLVVLWVRDWL